MWNSANSMQLTHSGDLSRDPLLSNGHKVVYKRACPVEIKTGQNRESIGSNPVEVLKVRILSPEEITSNDSIILELTNEKELFFHYTGHINKTSFARMKDEQGLLIKFENLLQVLIGAINNCVDNSNQYMAVLDTHSNGTTFSFLQNLDFKYATLLKLDAAESPTELVKRIACYRYKVLYAKLERIHKPVPGEK